MPETPAWRAKLEHNALWVSLAAILVGVAVVWVGVQVRPDVFWDRFVWEDIWGPLVVDAYQCRTVATCPALEGPPGIVVKDGYTVTSELTYGLVLAVMLYGIYVGLFRRFGIVANGWFVLGLTPWILLGPLARALEDANVFCRFGTDCDPGVFAYVFISPVIYIHIALYVIAFMLLGVYLERRRHADPRLLTGAVAAVLGMGVAAFALVGNAYGSGFSALPPLWWVAASALLGAALFWWRARQGLASMNLTVFVLGLPYALGCVWLIGRWLAGGVWSEAAWNGSLFVDAGAFVLAAAALVAATVYGLGKWLGGRAAWPARAGALAQRVPPAVERGLGWAGAAALAGAVLVSGAIPRLSAFFDDVPAKEVVIPLLGVGGLALLVAFALLHVGRETHRRPEVLLLYAAGINVALVLGHMIDGLATWVALEDPLGFGIPPYSEKHPFSDFLLRYWDGFLFPFAKLVMVLVVAWLLDREVGGRDAPPQGASASFDERNMVGLVKMAIFVLGFAPGLRDVLRLSMGV